MDHYSSLYTAAPNGDGTKIYHGPIGGVRGALTAVLATFSNTVADGLGDGSADVLHVCKVAEGSVLVGFTAAPSADLDADNDFTFNLGFTSASNGHASASTGLQAATAFALSAGDLIAADAAVAGDELLLTRVAGALDAAGDITLYALFLLP